MTRRMDRIVVVLAAAIVLGAWPNSVRGGSHRRPDGAGRAGHIHWRELHFLFCTGFEC